MGYKKTLNRFSDEITIALDAMGGDKAPKSVIEGAAKATHLYPDVKYMIYGDDSVIGELIQQEAELMKVSEVIHTSDVVSPDEKPSVAIRKCRKSSMGLAIKAVKEGKAAGAVSAGNTGALMALSKVMLRTLPGISRPAIGGVLPTKLGSSVMLDLGANVTCDAENLFDFAVMGDSYARAVLDIESPSIGMLNIGTEDMKGNDAVKNAAMMLRESTLPLNFYGFVEGDDITDGIVDVIVADGFTGNIALKTAEGTAKMCTAFLKHSLSSSLFSKIGATLARPALKSLRNKLDPRLYNGAMFLGLNGIIVKSHGGMDAVGFANAIGATAKLARHNINKQIINGMIESGHIDSEILL